MENVTVELSGVESKSEVGSVSASRTYDWNTYSNKSDAELRQRHERLETEALFAARAWFRGSISEGGLRLALAALEKFEAEL